MDIRCERCGTEYEFDDARVPEAGIAVRCTECGHVFRVYRPAAAPPSASSSSRPAVPPPPPPPPFVVRLGGAAELTACRDLATLQRWVAEGRARRTDLVSVSGAAFTSLGSLAELAPFFALVESPPAPDFHSAKTQVVAPVPPAVTAPAPRVSTEEDARETVQFRVPQLPKVPERAAPVSQPPPIPTDALPPVRPAAPPPVSSAPVSSPPVSSAAAAAAALANAKTQPPRTRPAVPPASPAVPRAIPEPRIPAHSAPVPTPVEVELDISLSEPVLPAAAAATEPNAAPVTAAPAAVSPGPSESVPCLPAVDPPSAAGRFDDEPSVDEYPEIAAFRAQSRRRGLVVGAVVLGLVAAGVGYALLGGAEPEAAPGAEPAVAVAAAPGAEVPSAPETPAAAGEEAAKADDTASAAPAAPEVPANGADGAAPASEKTADKGAPEKAAPDKPAADKAAAEMPAAEKGAPEKPAPGKPATEKSLVAEKPAAPEKPAPEKPSAEKVAARPEKTSEAAPAAEPPSGPLPDVDKLLGDASVLLEKNRPKQALALYDKALSLRPQHAEAHYGRGLALYEMNDTAAASTAFQTALKHNPRFADAMIGLAEILKGEGKAKEAVRWYKRYLEVLPNGDQAEVARANVERFGR